MKYSKKQLIEAGGKEWNNNGMSRVYFSVQKELNGKFADNLEKNVAGDVKLYFDILADSFEIKTRNDNYQTLQKELAEKAKAIIISKLH